MLKHIDRIASEAALDDERNLVGHGPFCAIDERDMMLDEKWERHLRHEGLSGLAPLLEYGQPTIGFGRSDDQVDVSVIIPTYNMERFLRQAIESALQSGDHANIELICINDGSTDSSLEIMADLARQDRRIKVIDKENSGYGATVNRGLDVARGRYVAILEPDDWVDPGMYDSLLSLAEEAKVKSGSYPDIVKSSYWRIVGSGTDGEHRLHCSYYRRVKDRTAPFRIQDEPHLVMHHPSIWSALYRREFLDEAGIRMKEVPGAGWVDNPWLYETMCQAKGIVYTNDAWYCYREDLSGSSSSGDVMALSMERWHDMMDILDRLGMADEGVRSSLHVIGFRYIQDIIRHDGTANPVIANGVDGMLRRMDLSIVSQLGNVSPKLLAMAFDAQGRPAPNLPPMRYETMLAREFGKTIQTDGIGTAVEKVRMKLRH